MSSREWDILVKMGARDKNGIRVAMHKMGASSVEEFYAMIEFYEAKRKIGYRVKKAIMRVLGGHRGDINARLLRSAMGQDLASKEIKARISRYKEIL